MSNITEQEKKFADAFVYLFFHAPALMPGMKEDAAAYAGYDLPTDRNAAENFANTLYQKPSVRKYIDAELERFREILSDDQSMNLWKHISEFKPGESTNDVLCGGCIIRH